MMTPETVWQQIKIEELAQALAISRMAVYKWRHSDHGIPDRRLLAVEAATGIDREELRPDLYQR